MSGCRGDPGVLEEKVWSYVKEARRAEVRTTAVEPDSGAAERAERLLAEAKRLRELARELLEKARELEEAADR